MKNLLSMVALSLVFEMAWAGPLPADSIKTNESKSPVRNGRLNFFIVSKRKKGQLDLATRFNTIRTKVRGAFHPNSFIAIIATDMNDAVNKMLRNLEETNTELGTVWFDSHGAYKKGYSLFYVGSDECNSHSLQDPAIAGSLNKMKAYCSNQTSVVIGSCYGGATYCRPAVDYSRDYKMDGDSLMVTLAKYFSGATIYGSESWVMSKPGLFNRKPAVGGNPGRKLFLDLCYKPAWENIGKWNRYESATGRFLTCNTIALDERGNLVIRDKPYVEEKKANRDIEKNLKKLQPGLYK